MDRITVFCVVAVSCTLLYGLSVTSIFKVPGYRNLKIKKIVLWTAWFGDRNWNHLMKGNRVVTPTCPYTCTVHTDRSDPLSYDALVFHGRNAQSPPRRRSTRQVYIMFVHESPYHSGNYFIKGDHFYNWSATYSHKSDVWVPYWYFERRKNMTEAASETPPVFNLGGNDSNQSVVLWIVSNCKTPSRREQYVSELRKHIKVDTYGGCGKRCYKKKTLKGSDCLKSLAATGKYKFYLSFENSACSWYITEKAQLPLLVGLVPIVYGGYDHQEYVDSFPPNSFIDVRTFNSPEHLARYLLYLAHNETAYMAYHAWRRDYEVWTGIYKDVLTETMCRICKAINNSSFLSPRNVNWGKFWNRKTECDNNFIDKVKGKANKEILNIPSSNH